MFEVVENSDLVDADENELDKEGEIEYFFKNLFSISQQPLVYTETLNITTNKLVVQKGIYEILIPPPKA